MSIGRKRNKKPALESPTATFFKRMKERLASIGWSQNSFADHLGIDRTQMSRWATGRVATPRYDTIARMEQELAALEKAAARKR